MATDHHDAQDYTANGPTTEAGFKTGGDGTGIANGVVAAGNVYGVHGIGLGTEGSSEETIGVYGESASGYGVKGKSTGVFSGVWGDSSSNQAGVKGTGNQVGVEGDATTGVFGRGETGVRGENDREGDGDGGFGVDGHSIDGTGVHGSSDRGRGGVFESDGRAAQVRLVPRVQETEEAQLSKKGKVGDLFLIRHTGTRAGRERFDFCSLWLCVPEIPSRDDSSQWQEVVLGRIATGTA